jgi:hypothetical protein
MHNYHGSLPPSGGQPVFPNDISSCYECHPGQITQCDRGAMKTGGMDCISCHNGMLAVGGEFPLQTGGSIDGTNDGSPAGPGPTCPAARPATRVMRSAISAGPTWWLTARASA